MEKRTYKVKRCYDGLEDPTTFRSFDRAIKCRDKREGLGWQVIDSAGFLLDVDFEGRPKVIAKVA